MNSVELKVGDVLLLKKEDAPGIYTFLKQFLGKNIADIIAKIEGHEYIHSELYVGNGYVLAAWFNGVHLIKYPLRILGNFDIYRHEKMDNEKRSVIKRNVAKYFNMRYDFASLILNGLPEILSLGFEPLERYLEKQLPYSDPNKMICSELVARMYKDAGIIIEPDPEFVTPDDIAQDGEMKKIF
ncbi:hypothetical protein [Marinitoga lauensis]|uniref:hypothetical protein n=1 Tax=Marinitoga lauensis TaxID=2201189 RepID=UPI001012E414|nr:hypothetical protein [Marinitoga lauensis]